jgi:serine/threonine protein kinase/Tfp pilus assembly protein PilF
MTNDSTFGVPPERLRRLLLFGRDESIDNDQPIKSWDLLNEKPGSEIGRYRLLRVLGEGGMGVVYLAQQEHPIKRRVALKIIKPGMDSKRVITRFEAERQTLALLEHPNIAHVHDAGTTENGRPYFVMEYVKGMTITEYCDHHKLTIEDRLRLFVQVCQAVQHAHQKGIIHRDIKPSNIIISLQDCRAIPKIIDFGVAKATNQPLTEKTHYTEQGQLFGTPEYMSPEQVDMANEDVDTRSDIYSLGVLLYVLLTGILPFDSDTLREGGIEKIRKVIRETDPKTPSTRLTRLGQEAQKIAESRRTEVAALVKCLHKELEWIPLKAMRKERSERYRSASELADDIESYLRHAPLIAGPPSTTYRFKKFTQRHRASVIGVVAVLFVLVAGMVFSTIFAIGQAHARAEAEAIADFLRNDVLASVSPLNLKGQDATVEYVLDVASQKLDNKFIDKPLVEASISETLGWTYLALGRYIQAEYYLEHASKIYNKHLPNTHQVRLKCLNRLGWVYLNQGHYEQTRQTWTNVLEVRSRAFGAEHPETLHTTNALGEAYWYLGRYEQAKELLLKVLKAKHYLQGEHYDLTFHAIGNLAKVYLAQGKYEEAERLSIRMLEDSNDVWGPEHPWTPIYEYTLAMVYRAQGRYEQAEKSFLKILEGTSRLWGAKHPYTLCCMGGLAQLYGDQGKSEDAEALLRKTLEISRHVLGDNHPITFDYINALGVVFRKQKKYEDAERLFYNALEGRKKILGEDHPATLESKNDLAVLYKEQSDYDKAEPLLIEAIEGRSLKLGDTHPHALESWHSLIDLYKAWDKPEKAEKWRANLPEIKTVEQ